MSYDRYSRSNARAAERAIDVQEIYSTGTTGAKVLADTYRLLAMSIMFAAVAATASLFVVAAAPAVFAITSNIFVFIGMFWFLTYMVEKNSRNGSGLMWMFATAGWLGFGLGPLLTYSLQMNGFAPVINASACTGLALLVTSSVGKAFPGIMRFGGIITTGILVAFSMALLNYFFFGNAGLALALSMVFGVLASAMISWQVAAIVHGGERNHVSAALTIFVMLYNLFTLFLSLFSNRD